MAKRQYKRSEIRENEKKCSRCEVWKPFNEFYPKKNRGDLQSRSAHSSQCKKCHRDITQKWISENKNQHKETVRRKSLMSNYGITLEQYDDMFTDQEGVCAICLEMESTHDNLSVDHCHSTGKIRGLLCSNCNRAIGLMKDKAEILHSAANYLERSEDL